MRLPNGNQSYRIVIRHPGAACVLAVTERVEKIFAFYSAPGFCDEKMYLYLAEGITPTSTRKTDQDEFVETVLLSRQAVREAIANNQIQDGKTLVGLQYWLLNSK